MVNARILITLILVGMLGACASTPPATFNPNDSKALNIARAAGIDAKLKDVEVPKDTVNNITDSAGFGFAMAASGYNSPIPGFSPNQMAAMNFTAWLLAPEADSARNSMFAWVPTAIGSEPITFLSDTISKSLKKAEPEIGYDLNITYMNNKSVIIAFLFKEGDPYCGEKDKCFISFGIGEPKNSNQTPTFISDQSPSYFFDPSTKNYSRYSFSKKYQGFNELDLLHKISAQLPKWFYLYAAPNKVKLDSEKKLKIPVVINEGKTHYFVKPNA